MKIRISILIFMLIFSTSCEKKHEQEKEKFLFTATAINQGDTSLVTLNIYVSIFYPDEHELLWLSASKWRAPSFPEKDYILHDFDSVQIIIDHSIYIGCMVDLLIGCHYKDKEYNYYVKNFKMRDTIKTEFGFDMRFTWPSDTSNFKYHSTPQ